MAGHSKWANIKFRKAAQDAKRGKIFTKLIREITVAARMGGEDLGSNPRLRKAIDDALAGNMKRDTIDRAIKRGAGSAEGDTLEEMNYEGYGPGGVAVLVNCLTDNKNRTVADVRHAFSKSGGNLGTEGSVAYLFTQQGQLTYQAGADADKILEAALESGADDVINNEDGSVDVITSPTAFYSVKTDLDAAGLSPDFSEIVMDPATQVTLDLESAEKVMRLIDMLENLDDVQKVYSNADISDEIFTQMNA